MKKIVLFAAMILTLVSLAACNSTSATAALDNYDITVNTVTVDVEVNDPDSEITGDTYIKIYDEDDELVSSQTLTFEDGETSLEDTITFTALDSDTEYTLKVIATVEKKNVELVEESFTTYAEEEVYITTAEEFLDMSSNRTGDYILSNDIDFTGVDFEIPFPSGKNFSGTFDGQGYTLSNITLTDIETYTGVFGYISSGEITNLNLDQIVIGTEEAPLETTTSTRVGFVAGYVSSNSGLISDVHVTNSSMHFSSESKITTYVGGIIGEMRGELVNVSATDISINVVESSYADTKIGGIVGLLYEDATLTEASVTGDINFDLSGTDFDDENDSYIYIGGVIGRNNATDNVDAVTNIYSMADINADIAYNTLEGTEEAAYSFNVGGLVGLSAATVDNGFYGGSITVNHTSTEFETNTYKQFNIAGLIGSYPGNVMLEGLIRYGDANTITINVSEDVHLNFNQLIAKDFKGNAHVFGVYGTQDATINDITVVDLAPAVDDIDNFFSSDWITEAFEALLS
jgi:hypothetical protein